MAPFTQWSVRGESFGVLFARLDVGVDVVRDGRTVGASVEIGGIGDEDEQSGEERL